MDKQELIGNLISALESIDKSNLEDVRFWIYAAIREANKD